MTIRLEFAKTNTKMQKYHNHPNFIHVNNIAAQSEAQQQQLQNMQNNTLPSSLSSDQNQPLTFGPSLSASSSLQSMPSNVSPTSPTYKQVHPRIIPNGLFGCAQRGDNLTSQASVMGSHGNYVQMSVAHVPTLTAASPVAAIPSQQSHLLASYAGKCFLIKPLSLKMQNKSIFTAQGSRSAIYFWTFKFTPKLIP